MRLVSRAGDITVSICCCHSSCVGTVGVLIPFQSHTKTEGRSNVRCLDISIHSCGHISIVATCSNFTTTVNRGQARLNDMVIGCPIGLIVTGSNLVKTK